MNQTKQPHLNGSYYGPSIPPPNYHRPRRRSNCACLISKLICSILVTIGLIILILWLILRPNKLKFHATEANLSQFTLSTTNNTLYYNLALNLRIRNPNNRVGVYYDGIEASGYYDNNRLQTKVLERFYQGRKNTADLKIVFQGESVVILQGSDRLDYDLETREGVYNIDVKLRVRIRLKAWWFKTPRFTSKVECDLKVPLMNNNGGISNSFQTTSCDIDW